MVTENIGVSFEDKKSLDIQVNIGGNEAFQVPVHVNSLDAEKVGQQIGEIITGDFDETLLANVAKEETLLEVKAAIENIGGSSGDIDLTGVAKENTLLTESAAIQSKIDNIQFPEIDTTSLAKQATLIKESETIQNAIRSIKLPDIDTAELAKQGENKNATNSKILEEIQKIPDLKNIYSVRFEKNDDGEDTYSMVLPIVAGVVANEDGETVTIKL